MGFAKLKGDDWGRADEAAAAAGGTRRPNNTPLPLTGCKTVSGVFCSVGGLDALKPNENTGLEVAVFVFESSAGDPVFARAVVLGAGFDEGKLNENEGFCA